MVDFDEIADRVGRVLGTEERGPIKFFLVVLGLFVVCLFLTSPLLSLEVFFGLFVLIAFALTVGAVFLNALIMGRIGTAIRYRIYQDWIITFLKIVGIIGSIAGLFFMIRGIINIQWAKWGIQEFYHSMGPSSNPLLPGEKSLLDPEVSLNLFAVLKAMVVNIGGVLWAYISNMLVPWSWITTTAGLIMSD